MKISKFVILDEEVTPEEIDVTSIVPKTSLNPKIWVNDELVPVVKTVAEKIVNNYIDFMFTTLEKEIIKDIQFTGSLANYNWSEYSDFDLHVVVDFSEISDNDELVGEYFRNKTTLYRLDHSYKIFEYDVELNVVNIEKEKSDVGIYSLTTNKWEQIPNKDHKAIDYRSVKIKASQLMNQIDSAACDIEDLTSLKTKIRKMRQSAIKENGEYAVENLAFKILRRNGYIKKLKDQIDLLEIKKL